MSETLLDWLKRLRQEHKHDAGRVLDIGSLDVNGSPRTIFSDATEYIGTDMRAGEGVDLQLSNRSLLSEFDYHSFDTILCLNTLEHDIKFWMTVMQIHAMLKPGGYFYFSSPTVSFPLHRHPKDYWRFTDDSLKEFIIPESVFELLNMEEVHTKIVDGKKANFCISGMGRKK